jgi:hypothetical protein
MATSSEAYFAIISPTTRTTLFDNVRIWRVPLLIFCAVNTSPFCLLRKSCVVLTRSSTPSPGDADFRLLLATSNPNACLICLQAVRSQIICLVIPSRLWLSTSFPRLAGGFGVLARCFQRFGRHTRNRAGRSLRISRLRFRNRKEPVAWEVAGALI